MFNITKKTPSDPEKSEGARLTKECLMDTRHCNALLDFMEARNNLEFTVNEIFDMQLALNKRDARIQIMQIELDLKDTLIAKMSEELYHLMSGRSRC